MWAVVENNKVVRTVTGSKQSVRCTDGILRPPTQLNKMTNEELRAVGVYPLIDNNELPPLHSKGEPVLTIKEEYVERTWQAVPVDLELAKAHVRQRINNIKAEKQDGVFEFDNTTFQCDQRSRDFIMGASIKALIAQVAGNVEFSMTFTDAENKDHVYDAVTMIALGEAAAAHVEQWHEWGKDKKQSLDNATTIEDVINILESL